MTKAFEWRPRLLQSCTVRNGSLVGASCIWLKILSILTNESKEAVPSSQLLLSRKATAAHPSWFTARCFVAADGTSLLFEVRSLGLLVATGTAKHTAPFKQSPMGRLPLWPEGVHAGRTWLGTPGLRPALQRIPPPSPPSRSIHRMLRSVFGLIIRRGHTRDRTRSLRVVDLVRRWTILVHAAIDLKLVESHYMRPRRAANLHLSFGETYFDDILHSVVFAKSTAGYFKIRLEDVNARYGSMCCKIIIVEGQLVT